MQLRSLSVGSFRNLRRGSLTAGPTFNVLSGDNGQGKTNLLEAIYLVATLRSFRTLRLEETIQHGEQWGSVEADVEHLGLHVQYRVVLEKAKKTVSRDGKKPAEIAHYFGGFNVVLFVPDDLAVPRGAPVGRRRLLDRAAFNRDPLFLSVAQRYQRVLRSRNVVLREASPREDLLEVYDQQLAVLGTDLRRRREETLALLLPRMRQAFATISGDDREVTARYLGAQLPLEQELAQSRARDRLLRRTTAGPHSDDVEFLLDDRRARIHASQGQTRALMLAWKTAELRLLLEERGEPPILLLDDVSSELDARRTLHLFSVLDELRPQCFVTTTDPSAVPALPGRKDFCVVSGELAAVSPL